MNNDSELLRRYSEERSEAAFTELVQRYVGLVYSVALRRVGGDAHLAEDVVQKVFSDLARKPASLIDRATISGWLYASAHLASAACVRTEQRRKARETEAYAMQTALSSDAADADWTKLRPVIDDAIMDLREDERVAVVLRFFEKRSFAEVGQALRVTEEAARKRVDRALEKLHATLAQRGVTSTAAALGLTLTAIATVTPPSVLTTRVATHAIAQGAAPTVASTASTAISALLPAAAALVIGGLLIGSQRRTNDTLRTEFAQVTTENRATATLRAENLALARRIALAEEARRLAAASALSASAPVVAPPPAPRAVSARVSVSERGTIDWNHEPVKLHDFVMRLRTLQVTASPETRIVIRGMGAEFSPLAYVIDEIRKAKLQHVTVESDATPDPKLGFSWF